MDTSNTTKRNRFDLPSIRLRSYNLQNQHKQGFSSAIFLIKGSELITGFKIRGKMPLAMFSWKTKIPLDTTSERNL